MYPHHQATIEKAVEGLRQDPTLRAVIVGGSIAKGVAKPTSDVDLMLVVTEEEFARRRRERAYTLLSYAYHDYEGGYVDAKYVDLSFLRAAAVRGSEPTRDSFRGAYPIWSAIDGLEDVLAQIPVYPEMERADKIRRFYSQALLQLFFLNHGPERRLLLTRAAADMVFFTGRLLLAYHRVLFPSAKRLMERVESLPGAPGDFLTLADRLLENPTVEHGRALMDAVNSVHDWGIDWDTALSQYVEDSEFNWLDGPPPLADS